MSDESKDQKLDLSLDSETSRNVERILTEQGGARGSLISLLQAIQKELNYLPPGALPIVARQLNLPLSQIVSVARFYGSFSLLPRGKHIVTCCLGTACHVRGAARILAEVSRILRIDPDETTEDKIFSFDIVRCLGACALAPVMVVDGVFHGKMTPKKAKNILQHILREES